MNPINFECPHCQALLVGDTSMYGQSVKCWKCQATILVPPAPVAGSPQMARLIPAPSASAPTSPNAPSLEADVFTLSPAARASTGAILIAAFLVALAIGVAVRGHEFSWPPQWALIPLALAGLVLLGVWIGVKSSSYRLTTQRLFVRRGWLAKRVNEMELYRVKDVRVDQGALQRLLGYGTITVLADDDTTPEVQMVGIAAPTKIKEMIRTEYRAARQREGVRPTEFLQSP